MATISRSPAPVQLTALALEPRFMFDAAGAATAVEAAAQTEPVPDAPDDAGEAASLLAALTATPEAGRKEVVFVDTRVPDYRSVVASVSPDAEVVLIDTGRDGVAQIAEALAGRTDVDAIHIVSHGDSGVLLLGNGALHAGNMDAHADALAGIGQALAADGDIHLWGCEVGAGDKGAAFLDALAEVTGADIAASDDDTGAGGDWQLEVAHGTVAASDVLRTDLLAGYDHDLATLTASTLTELRTRLATAAANGEADTITLLANISATGSGDMAASSTDGHLTMIDINITDGQALEIVGGGYTLDANYYGRVLEVRAGAVEISNLTIRDGLISGNGGSYNSVNGGDALGAGIRASGGDLTLSGVAITGNRAGGGGGNGGGVGYGYGGGGGGGFGGTGGGDGGAYSAAYAGGTGGGGTGGNGGFYSAAAQAGQGGGATGGAGGATAGGFSSGGAGGTAGTGGTTIGGGGAGAGASAAPAVGRGGNAVAAMHIASGATVSIAGSTITDNLAAGGGGAGSSNTVNAQDGGFGVGGIYVLGTLNYESATVDLIGTDNSNYGAGGSGGSNQNGMNAGVAGAGGNTGGENVSGSGTINSSYSPNAAPAIDANGATGGTTNTTTFTEDGGAIRIVTSDATLTDDDNVTGMTLVLGATPNGASESIAYDAALNGGAALGTLGLTGSYDSGTRTYTLSGTASAAVYQGVLRAMVYDNTSQNPDTTARTVTITATDAEGAVGQTTATINVTAQNDAPTLTGGGSHALPGTDEGTANAGTLVSAILAANGYADADAGASSGIAVTGRTGNGSWQFSVDGTTWGNIPSVGDVSALLLTSTSQVRYVPDNRNGETATLTFRAWDQTTGTASAIGALRFANVTTNGGTTAFSSQTASSSVTVTDVNDAPTVTNGHTVTMTGTDEETASASVTVASVLTAANRADHDTGALGGIAVVIAGGNGTWQYSMSGGATWTDFGSVAPSSGLLLTPDAEIRFVPDGRNGGTATITFRAWDQTSGTASADGAPSKVATSPAGTTTAFSSSSANLSISVSAVNDAPTATNLTQAKATTEGGGAVALDDIVVSDVDTGETITATLTLSSPSAGSLTVGTYGAATSTWNAGTGVWTVTGSAADVNAALAAVALTPSADNDQNFTITTRIRDAADTGPADGTITVTVTAVNDAPVVTVPASISVTEDTATALTGISFSDTDAGANTVTVTLSVPSGTLAATGGGGVTVGGTASALTLAGTVADINAFIAASNVTFTTAPNATADVTLTVAIDDGGNTGTGGAQQDSAAVTLDVTAVNDAPTVTGPGSIVVTVNEAGALTGISFADMDAGANAVTVTLSVPSGTLAATGGGGVTVGGTAAALTLTGTVADINAFIAASNVTFTTAPSATADVTLTVTIDDGGNTGAGGARQDSTTVTITPSERPVVATGGGASHTEDGAATVVAPSLTITDGDSSDMTGATVTITDFVTGDVLGFTDQNGIAGSWNAGTGVLTLTGTATREQYQAALRSITYSTTSDNPATGAGNGDRVIEFRVTDGGLQSAAGTNQTVTVANANDAPVLDASQSPVLTGVAEDTGAPANGSTVGSTLVSALLGGASDVDTGALQGIAVTAVSAQGTLWYSTDGGTTWTQAPAVSGANALLLHSDARLYFQPAANVNGTISDALTFRAWDRNTGANGGTADTTANGGGTAFSTATDTASVTVTSVNDAPTLDAGTYVLPGTDENTAGGGTAVSTILAGLNAADVDAGAQSGIAVTSVSGNGTWQYSTNGGADWFAVGGVSAGGALLLSSTAQIRYVPDAANGETGGSAPTIGFRAWDRTSGSATDGATRATASTAANGGSNAFSAAAASASLQVAAVNDAPTVTAGATHLLAGTNEDTTSGSTLVSTVLAGVGVGDVDSGAVSGIAVTGVTGNGAWGYSTDGTAWTAFGPVSGSDALLLSSTMRIRYVPDGRDGETATFSFRAWDRTTGAASADGARQTADATATGGSTAFSTGSANASIAVGAVNDAPVLTVPGSTGVTESTASPVTGITIADVDAGNGTVTVTLSLGSGTLAASSGGGVTVGGTATALTLAGTVADINAFIAASRVTYTTAPHDVADRTLTVTVDDGGNTGSGGARQDSGTVTLTVSPQVPTVASVAAPADGLYGPGSQLDFTVTFSEAVTVDAAGGTPRLALDVGGTTVYADYVSGTGSAALVFRYTVAAGQLDADGLAVAALQANGGTLRDVNGNDAVPALANVGATGGVRVDAVAPAAPAIAAITTDTGSSSTDAVTSDRTLVLAGTAEANGTVTLYRGGVQIGTATADGAGAWSFDYTGTVLADGGYVFTAATTDAAGNTGPASAAFAVTVDGTQPAVASVAVPADRTYKAGETLEFAVAFDDAVLVSGGAPSLALTFDKGQTTVQATLAEVRGNVLVFRYVVQSGDLDRSGITVAPAIALNGAALTDRAGNALAVPALTGLPSMTGVKVVAVNDAAPPAAPPVPPAPPPAPPVGLSGGSPPPRPVQDVVAGLGGTGSQGPAPATTGLGSPLGGFGPPAGSAPPALPSPTPVGTGDVGYVVIGDASVAGLSVIGDVSDVAFSGGGQFTFSLPPIFAHSDPNQTVAVEARLADGSPLPAWLRFDPATGTFVGEPPPGAQDVEVVVTARDADGAEVSTRFELRAQERSAEERRAEAPAGKPSLSAQLKSAGQEGMMAEALALLESLAAMAEPPLDEAA